MNDLDIPIIKKSYDLYKEFYKLRLTVPKQDRYNLWQKCEGTLITVLEGILMEIGRASCRERVCLYV